jgi:hypothetical protein
MERHTVYVPLVRYRRSRDDAGEAAICELWCEQRGAGEPRGDVPCDADRRVAPIAAPLLASHLFEAGCAAAMAVRKLGTLPPRLGLWQRLRPYAWLESRRLHAAGAIPHLGDSAELGLALALLLPKSRHDASILATGSLTGDAPELRERDAAVFPVGAVEEKLADILRRVQAGTFTPSNRWGRVPFFTPRADERGRPVAELAVAAQLKEAGIEVVPISWLSEAARRLGCERAPLLPADRVSLATAILLALGLAAGGAASLWRHYPIPLAFVRGGGEAIDPEPFLACITPEGLHSAPRPVPRSDQIPRVRTGQQIAWAVRAGDRGHWDARLLDTFGSEGYSLLFAVISQDGRLLLADRAPAGEEQASSPPYRVRPGGVFEQWFQIPGELGAGEHALAILAARNGGFDTNALGRALRAGAGAPNGADFVNRAVNFLQSQAPGFLVYQFSKSDDVPDRCAR